MTIYDFIYFFEKWEYIRAIERNEDVLIREYRFTINGHNIFFTEDEYRDSEKRFYTAAIDDDIITIVGYDLIDVMEKIFDSVGPNFSVDWSRIPNNTTEVTKKKIDTIIDKIKTFKEEIKNKDSDAFKNKLNDKEIIPDEDDNKI